jgi:uncharacterized membrane protein YphA (DoxX/SURF4 family)
VAPQVADPQTPIPGYQPVAPAPYQSVPAPAVFQPSAEPAQPVFQRSAEPVEPAYQQSQASEGAFTAPEPPVQPEFTADPEPAAQLSWQVQQPADAQDLAAAQAQSVSNWTLEPPTQASDPAQQQAAAPEALGALAPDQSIFRVPEAAPPVLSEEQQKLADERAARREARVSALTSTTSALAPAAIAAPTAAETVEAIIKKSPTDKFFGSLGLFLLRLMLAFIFGYRGVTMLTVNLEMSQTQLQSTILPSPEIWLYVISVSSMLIALSLVLGFLTRVAGLGIAAISVGALVFVQWGAGWNPFATGQAGFLGEFELLLAVVGIMFLTVGAGGWSIDRSIRASRERSKAERAAIDA